METWLAHLAMRLSVSPNANVIYPTPHNTIIANFIVGDSGLPLSQRKRGVLCNRLGRSPP
jgi:hypothetical protein